MAEGSMIYKLSALGFAAAAILTGGLAVGAASALYAISQGLAASPYFWSGFVGGSALATLGSPYVVGRAMV